MNVCVCVVACIYNINKLQLFSLLEKLNKYFNLFFSEFLIYCSCLSFLRGKSTVQNRVLKANTLIILTISQNFNLLYENQLFHSFGQLFNFFYFICRQMLEIFTTKVSKLKNKKLTMTTEIHYANFMCSTKVTL